MYIIILHHNFQNLVVFCKIFNIFQINIFSLLVSYSKLPLFYINIHTLYHVHVFIFLTFLSRSTHKKRSSSVTPLLVHTWKKKNSISTGAEISYINIITNFFALSKCRGYCTDQTHPKTRVDPN